MRTKKIITCDIYRQIGVCFNKYDEIDPNFFRHLKDCFLYVMCSLNDENYKEAYEYTNAICKNLHNVEDESGEKVFGKDSYFDELKKLHKQVTKLNRYLQIMYKF